MIYQFVVGLIISTPTGSTAYAMAGERLVSFPLVHRITKRDTSFS